MSAWLNGLGARANGANRFVDHRYWLRWWWWWWSHMLKGLFLFNPKRAIGIYIFLWEYLIPCVNCYGCLLHSRKFPTTPIWLCRKKNEQNHGCTRWQTISTIFSDMPHTVAFPRFLKLFRWNIPHIVCINTEIQKKNNFVYPSNSYALMLTYLGLWHCIHGKPIYMWPTYKTTCTCTQEAIGQQISIWGIQNYSFSESNTNNFRYVSMKSEQT